MGQAFVFIVLTFFGFESCSTVAEEVRNPRKNLPIALIGSVLLTGLWFTLAVYAIIVGYGAKHIDQLAGAIAPLHDLAVTTTEVVHAARRLTGGRPPRAE